MGLFERGLRFIGALTPADGDPLVYDSGVGLRSKKPITVTRFGATAGSITLGSVANTDLIQNSVTMPVTVSFPASGQVLFEIEATCFPTANNSQYFVGLSTGGTQYSLMELLVSGEIKGRKRVSNILSGTPNTTATYTVSGHYTGGSGGTIAANTASGQPFVVVITPL